MDKKSIPIKDFFCIFESLWVIVGIFLGISPGASRVMIRIVLPIAVCVYLYVWLMSALVIL